ncbi:alpha-1D adrenergic receptor-like [Lytechinus pictus]|uniref:alpha-1D adrenergic receptor-like n=1 Tax=Lytechinus pictus TaxID=7653 RepID=UPI0030BA05FF
MASTIPPHQNSSSLAAEGGSDGRLYVLENPVLRIIIGTLFVVISIVGAIGNLLIISSIALSRKLRSATNCFIGNLAVADLLSCLSLPFNAVAMFSMSGWPLPGWICALVSTVVLNCISASVLTLAFIAFNRWYLLGRSKEIFQKLYTPRKMGLMIVFSWLYPFVLILAPHFSGFISIGYSEEYKICALDTGSKYADYYSMMGGLLVILPAFVALFVIYIRIYRLVTKHEETIQSTMGKDISDHSNSTVLVNRGFKGSNISIPPPDSSLSWIDPGEKNIPVFVSRQDSSPARLQSGPSLEVPFDLQNKNLCNKNLASAPTSTGAPAIALKLHRVTPCTNLSLEQVQQGLLHKSPGQKGLHNKSHILPMENKRQNMNIKTVKITKKLAIIVVVFVVCTLPFGIGTLVPPSRPAVPWNYLLLFFNSCVNPIIYAWTMRSFRDVMGCIARCRFYNIKDPTEFARFLRR